MSAAREAILRRIRSAGAAAEPAPTRGYRRSGARTAPERLELFCERIADYRAEVLRVGAADLRDAIAEVLASRSAARVGIPIGLPSDWRPGSGGLIEDNELAARELDRLDGALTGCTVAIAETGTIVLSGRPSEGRRALSLVPDLHVCVVGAEQIVELVPEAIAVLGELVRRERAPVTFISGPSATSDIELNRVEGVHGPRTLVVLIVSQELP